MIDGPRSAPSAFMALVRQYLPEALVGWNLFFVTGRRVQKVHEPFTRTSLCQVPDEKLYPWVGKGLWRGAVEGYSTPSKALYHLQ